MVGTIQRTLFTAAALSWTAQQPSAPAAFGKPIQIEGGLALTVLAGSTRTREAFSAGGKPSLIIDLRFDAKDVLGLSLEPSSDGNKSDIFLKIGSHTVAPTALAPYDVDKALPPEVVRVAALTPMPTTGKGYLSMVFGGQRVIGLLFELPESAAQSTPRVLHLSFEVGRTRHTLHVPLP